MWSKRHITVARRCNSHSMQANEIRPAENETRWNLDRFRQLSLNTKLKEFLYWCVLGWSTVSKGREGRVREMEGSEGGQGWNQKRKRKDV